MVSAKKFVKRTAKAAAAVSTLGGSVVVEKATKKALKKIRRDKGPERPRGISSFVDAEVEALRAVHQWGYRDARLTARGADGGVDISSKKLAVQVKRLTTGKVGSPEIQKIYGAAHPKQPVFFAYQRDQNSRPYSDRGVAEARRLGVALFGLLPDGTPVAYNSEAKTVRAHPRRLR